MEIDKKNGSICFNEKEHIYWNENDDEKYISVTTLIDKFAQPYDKEFWSAYKTLEKLLPAEDWEIEKKSLLSTHKFNKEILDVYDIPEETFNREQQNLLDQWLQTNLESQERGTRIHAELENSFYKMGANCSLKRFGIGGKFTCDKGRTNLDLENGVYPEYLISRTSKDGILRIAGQIDLLVKNGNHIVICDWKTNKEIKKHSGFDTRAKTNVKMKYPLNTLEDCNFYHYTLQLSTYAWMVQKLNPEFVIDDLILVHFDHQGNQTIYHLDYLKKEVEMMLAYYKKMRIHELQEEKYKEIEY
jgi:hypothetical protein